MNDAKLMLYSDKIKKICKQQKIGNFQYDNCLFLLNKFLYHPKLSGKSHNGIAATCLFLGILFANEKNRRENRKWDHLTIKKISELFGVCSATITKNHQLIFKIENINRVLEGNDYLKLVKPEGIIMDLADFEQNHQEDIWIEFFENKMSILNWRNLPDGVCEEIIDLNRDKYNEVVWSLSEGVVIND